MLVDAGNNEAQKFAGQTDSVIMKKIVLPILFWLAVTMCRADGPYHFIKDIPVGGDGGWDYLSVDSAAHRLYVSHATKIVVIDLGTTRLSVK